MPLTPNVSVASSSLLVRAKVSLFCVWGSLVSAILLGNDTRRLGYCTGNIGSYNADNDLASPSAGGAGWRCGREVRGGGAGERCGRDVWGGGAGG